MRRSWLYGTCDFTASPVDVKMRLATEIRDGDVVQAKAEANLVESSKPSRKRKRPNKKQVTSSSSNPPISDGKKKNNNKKPKTLKIPSASIMGR